MIRQIEVIERLEESGMRYEAMRLQDGSSAIITQHGGRILGPFPSGDEESILWLNTAFADKDAFSEFLKRGEWNIGGERVWIAPEINYNVRDLKDFWGSYALPREVDPGSYTLSKSSENEYLLEQAMTLDTFNTKRVTKHLVIKRSIRTATNPLRHLACCESVMTGVKYAGWEHSMTLSEADHDWQSSEVWNLLQVRAGGVLSICCLPGVECTDYYEPVTQDFQTIDLHHIRLRMTGRRRYKVGYKATSLLGRAGYLLTCRDGDSCLLVRSFFVNPSSIYGEAPYHSPQLHGHAMHVYNDSGSLGSFGEIECNGHAIGAETGLSTATDTMNLWIFRGVEERVKAIARLLLGDDVLSNEAQSAVNRKGNAGFAQA